MSNIGEHLAHRVCAESNEELAAELADTAHYEWAVTLVFYSALHYFDCFFAARGQRQRVHHARNIQIENRFPDLWKKYRRLQTMSEQARYDLVKMGDSDYRKALQLLADIKSAIPQ